MNDVLYKESGWVYLLKLLQITFEDIKIIAAFLPLRGRYGIIAHLMCM